MAAMAGGVAEQIRPAAAHAEQLLTVGVEEEFLLVDAATGVAAPAVDAVVANVPPELRGQVQLEFQTSQIEIGSPPGLCLDALRHSLGLLRTGVSDAAEQAGVRLLAVGTGPVDGPVPPLVGNPRFHRMIERYGMLVPGPGLNGMHVHVGVPDPETGVQVLDHLRPWLPVLHAATANSPFYAGRDTGYASWRSMLWNRWPSVGPMPWLESHEHYERLIRELIESGLILDEGMLYWYSRLSARYPTVEIRIGDVCSSLDDTILIAALVRGLVGAALDDIAAGRPAHRIDQHLLEAAHWRAAHDGLEGLAVDLLDGGALRPAWEFLLRLVDRVGPQLRRHGDLDTVTPLLEKLRHRGSGAARQRAVHDRTGELGSVVDHLATATRS
ncbi:carboxylate-amine ligase [Polymorphospora rubra]|uniref:carboxylate-amine ligase n=1 Tax=Polymorphospora rubra TaxID=338584 RepID=UPI003F4CF311